MKIPTESFIRQLEDEKAKLLAQINRADELIKKLKEYTGDVVEKVGLAAIPVKTKRHYKPRAVKPKHKPFTRNRNLSDDELMNVVLRLLDTRESITSYHIQKAIRQEYNILWVAGYVTKRMRAITDDPSNIIAGTKEGSHRGGRWKYHLVSS